MIRRILYSACQNGLQANLEATRNRRRHLVEERTWAEFGNFVPIVTRRHARISDSAGSGFSGSLVGREESCANTTKKGIAHHLTTSENF